MDGLLWSQIGLMALGLLLIYLSYRFDLEPLLLMPIGFFMFMVNIPNSPLAEQGGLMDQMFNALIKTELLPLIIFIGVGAMMDFGPLIANPSYMILGLFSQLGIFIAFFVAILFGFDIPSAASIASIGTADGPTSIYVASKLKPDLVGTISMAAYSYVSIVPLLIPPLLKGLVTRNEIKAQTTARADITKNARLLFPFIVTLTAGFIAPMSLPLLGFLVFGYFLKENEKTPSLKEAAEEILAPVATIFVGVLIGSSIRAESFFQLQTLAIMGIGLFAFIMNIAAGILVAKVMHIVDRSFNPALGAAGNSAFPMAARVVHRYVQKMEPSTFLLLPAVSANVAGQLGSVFAGTFLLQTVLSGLDNPLQIAGAAFGRSLLAMLVLVIIFSGVRKWK
ncbi:sodium ion-translocating decarboxylase subunit beta [Coprothermobacter proteolyticus]|uniref:sodium ion-translocating decarboxylase subunit beta n=1 Tax=Coprothermobacter proteolyticus TaxID=35786 RepID=UPI000D2FA901|nr:sodium ion-translocating decarboxylase subunit beta [Coprothermobacter proteolyticus]NLT83344.1 sodium ion-translocating decarboxylase subunit beta [Coprothermobacter proteolyticus]